ncbi:universal stress protein UspA [Pseudidiomarina salinarum]|uniref:Universal stress protein UspA n=1 Tax=Pseudidiomarina salinarum TaxID=435908 RepID=A0A094ITV1_9GAMM|nr:universal stress protein [Pseudidiomarina salinarum]KFZ30562.1 universal stress protein UspA [Pseudidiomarina salinarum]RUO69070.1 universal stress protein [Pseudidiomarina salinarum]
MTNVVGCIDGSAAATAVCDYSAWAALQLDAPLMLLHVLDLNRYPVAPDVTGNIGLGSREHLLEELAELDAQRAKVALKEGHVMLEAAESRAREDGIANIQLRQRHGDLSDTLQEMEGDIRLVVLGLHGEDSSDKPQHIGSQLETVIRTLHRPILLTPFSFSAPASAMLAFDGSATTRKGVEMLAKSPLFKGMPVHVVMVDADTSDNWEKLKWAEQQLAENGHEVHIALRAGDVEPTLHAYQAEHNIDIMVMGAYGHSRIRQFLVGSTTSSMLQASKSPMLILR